MTPEKQSNSHSNKTLLRQSEALVVGSMVGRDGCPVSEYPPFYKLQVGGWASLRDLSEQFRISVVNAGLPEPKRLASLRAGFRVHMPDPRSDRWALIRSHRAFSLLLGWTILEAVSNLIAQLTIAVSDGVEGAHPRIRKLTPHEFDCLLERQTYFDAKKHQTPTRPNFLPVLDKLSSFPMIFAAVRGIEFSLDRSGLGWQCLVRAKDVRNRLTHSRLVDVPLNSLIDSSIVISVSDDDIVGLVNGITWYVSCLWPLVEFIFAGLFLGTLQLVFFDVCDAYEKLPESVATAYGFRMDQMIGA